MSSFVNLSRAKKRTLVLKIRNLITSSVCTKEDIPHLLKSVFTKNFDYGLCGRSQDLIEKNAIIKNVRRSLKEIRNKEHQSGTFRAIVTVCSGDNISKGRLAHQLRIARNSVIRVI